MSVGLCSKFIILYQKYDKGAKNLKKKKYELCSTRKQLPT